MKKQIRIIGLVLALLMIAAVFAASVSAASYIRGDANADGDVSILDATAIQRYLASFSVKHFDTKAADVDGDGVNIIDATRIQRYLASYYDPFNIGSAVGEKPTSYELPFIPD